MSVIFLSRRERLGRQSTGEFFLGRRLVRDHISTENPTVVEGKNKASIDENVFGREIGLSFAVFKSKSL